MNGKMAEVRRLLAEGYEMHDIQSDDGAVEATFRRAGRIVKVRFSPAEAERLLMTRMGR